MTNVLGGKTVNNHLFRELCDWDTLVYIYKGYGISLCSSGHSGCTVGIITYLGERYVYTTPVAIMWSSVWYGEKALESAYTPQVHTMHQHIMNRCGWKELMTPDKFLHKTCDIFIEAFNTSVLLSKSAMNYFNALISKNILLFSRSIPIAFMAPVPQNLQSNEYVYTLPTWVKGGNHIKVHVCSKDREGERALILQDRDRFYIDIRCMLESYWGTYNG